VEEGSKKLINLYYVNHDNSYDQVKSASNVAVIPRHVLFNQKLKKERIEIP
jgi:hypothetical protein